MDLSFSAEELAFRDEVHEFVANNLPARLRDKIAGGRHPSHDDIVDWTRILYAKGWSVPHWPKEWGGTGWDPVKLSIFNDEIQRGNAPEPLAFGTSMVGPVIYTFGSEAQKERFLPRIADLSDWWCQGFSEPGAGSDLAGLRTKAERDGESWVINGQKAWTTLAQYADWIFVLARTDPTVKKQQGISFLLVDMKTSGVTVRPIQTIDGGYEVNEVFFDDVRVPAENIVGKPNKGWDYAKFLLSNERNGIARVGISKARLKKIRRLAEIPAYGDKPKIDDPVFRMKLAAVEVELKALEMTQMRVIAAGQKAEQGKPNPMSSVLKIKGSEIQQATTELLMDVVGPYALPFEPEREDGERWNEPPVGPDWAATIAPTYFNLRKVSIYGGSNEIQRGIIAKAILGL
ncbi:MAG: pimeloyl-CoA dehydrogenase large subunit [Roseiarcus sp.]